MKHTLHRVAVLKRTDLIGQCLTFGIMCFVISNTDLKLFGLYVMAAGQCLSALIWSIYFAVADCPQFRMGRWIRIIFLLLGAFLLLALMMGMQFFLVVSMLMMVAGPVLGLIHFVATLREAGYYAKARKPYFLL